MAWSLKIKAFYSHGYQQLISSGLTYMTSLSHTALFFLCCNLTRPEGKTLCCGLYTFCMGLAGHFSHLQEGRKEERRSQRIPKHSALYSFHGHFSYPGSVPLQLIAWTLSYHSNNFLPSKKTNRANQLGSWAPSHWGQQNWLWITCQVITSPVSVHTTTEDRALELISLWRSTSPIIRT